MAALTPFTNPARTDDLVLRHWKRLQPNDTNGDVAMGDVESQDGGAAAAAATATADAAADARLETNYEYAKFNVQPEGPEYDDETYEAHLRSEDWSKEETDYLVETVKDYYHRWSIVADRYDWQPTQPKVDPEDAAEGGAVAAPAIMPKPRTMEDLKARYYQISAKLMELKTPIASMTNAEFGLHEVLTRFDPDREKQRKKVAAALLERTADEIKEEQYLLGELQRINTNYEKLSTEREEVRQRLFAPSTTGSSSTASQFQSSHALSQLFNQLLQQDRSKKRNGRLSLNTADQLSTPSGQQTPMTAGGNHRGSALDAGLPSANSLSRGSRQSIHTPGASGSNNNQGGGTAPNSATTQHHPSQPPRTLTPRAQQRLGVTQHEQRLPSGVSFKSDRLHKLRTAKSTVQTAKVGQALAELRIPDMIALPTAAVCDGFEVLVGKIHRLLELRKLLDKEEAEVAVAEGVRRERERRERAERGEPEEPEEPEERSDDGEGGGEGDDDGKKAGERRRGGGGAKRGEGGGGGGQKKDDDVDMDGNADDADADADADGEAEEDDADGEVVDDSSHQQLLHHHHRHQQQGQQRQQSDAGLGAATTKMEEEADTEMMDAPPADDDDEEEDDDDDGEGEDDDEEGEGEEDANGDDDEGVANGVKEEVASPAIAGGGGGRSASVASQGSGGVGKRNRK
ncbi:swr complex subunit [Diplodia seriata]|uniref:SWR1-complex protein 4 n=1 Tax=Diplodia seriata TaxID=420778 RepID=A0ABR3CQP2_9PEZI